MSFAIHQANLLGQARAEIATKDAEIARLQDSAQFLLDRLSELSFDDAGDELFREWNGHVGPAMARLRAALSPMPDPAGEMPVEMET